MSDEYIGESDGWIVFKLSDNVYVLATYGSLIVSIVSYIPITTCILRSTVLTIGIQSKGGGVDGYYAH